MQGREKVEVAGGPSEGSEVNAATPSVLISEHSHLVCVSQVVPQVPKAHPAGFEVDGPRPMSSSVSPHQSAPHGIPYCMALHMQMYGFKKSLFHSHCGFLQMLAMAQTLHKKQYSYENGVLYEEGKQVDLYTSSDEDFDDAERDSAPLAETVVSPGGAHSDLEDEIEVGELDESIASFSSSFSQNTSPADSPIGKFDGLQEEIQLSIDSVKIE